jgi:PAS domain-containing protein
MTWPPEQKKRDGDRRAFAQIERSKWDREKDELRVVNQRLSSVLASIDDLVFVLDCENRVVFI